MCNTFAVYFQIFATFGYKKVKNSESTSVSFINFNPRTHVGCDYIRKGECLPVL